MSLPKIAAHFETQLVNKIDSNSVSLELASVSTPAGNLPAGTYGFVIDEESSSKREYVIGTLSGSTVTLTKRDVSAIDATTEDASGDTARQSHRKGASIKITNFPILLLIQRILDGTDQLDAAAPLEYDGTASISGANQLATKAYVDSVVNGGTLILQDQVLLGDAGETIAAGNYVYLNESDGEWYKVDADTAAHLDGTRKGIAQGSGTDGNAIAGGILVEGLDTNAVYTTGQVYYASNTAGGLSTSAGTNSYKVGVGDANGKLVIFTNPNEVTVKEKAALAGGGDFGTPSSTNKFITEDLLSARTPQVVTFTASGTWTKDAGLKYIVVEVQGGGGGGGSDSNSSDTGGGGGGGGYARKVIAASALGATETVTIGAAGAGAVGDANGSAGGSSSFGSHVTANGGAGGLKDNGAGGAGGTATGGDINIQGQDGSTVLYDNNQGSSSYEGAFGGSSMLGRGGQIGSAARGYGAGGANTASGTAGIVIVTEYYS